MAVTFGANQITIAASRYKLVSWLFTITTTATADPPAGNAYPWSHKAIIYDAQPYTAKIDLESIVVTLTRGKSELGLVTPNSLKFRFTNAGNTYTSAKLRGAAVLVKLVVSDGTLTEIMRTWRFRVKKAEGAYQWMNVECEDFVQQYIKGDYPNTPLVKNLWYSIDPDAKGINDTLSIPIPFGTCYVPLRSVYISADTARYYVLGPSAHTYTITEVRSPRAWGAKRVWASGDGYAFTQSTKTGSDGNTYDVFQPIIADSDSDTVADANGLWREGERFLDMPTKFSRDDTSALTAPGDVIEFVLEDMGVPSADINTGAGSTFATANTVYSGWSLAYNGGYFYKQDRAEVISQLLYQCHSCFQVTDKLELHVLSKDSQATLTKANVIRQVKQPGQREGKGEGSFKYSLLDPSLEDAGNVAYQEAGEAQDEFHKIIVPTVDGGTPTQYAAETIICNMVSDSQDVQRIGTLYFQRKLEKDGMASFKAGGFNLDLQPNDVITLNHADYGGNYAVLMDTMTIHYDLSIDMKCIKYAVALEDWAGVNPGAITIAIDAGATYWTSVIVGPDASVSSGTMPNLLPGRLKVGDATNYILFDPFIPIMSFYQGAQIRVKVGDLGTGDYGVEFLDSSGNSILKLDGSGGNILAGWTVDSNKFTCDSGAVGLNSEVTGGTDWRIWAGHATPGSAPFRVDENGNLYATSAIIQGIITAGEIHIPDQDVTGESFHVQPDGDSWWGCTETEFNADPDNALAYILKTGIAKFQNVALGATVGGAVELGYTNMDTFIINFDEDDVDVELRFARTTGGAASITWNGALVQCSKALKPVDLGINNISASAPGTPFAGQVWLDVS